MPVYQRVLKESDDDMAERHTAFLHLFQQRYGAGEKLLANLPFVGTDVTGGSEHELQAVVIGRGDDVDLVRTIRNSNYFANINKRAAAGELSHRDVDELRKFLDDPEPGAWENSWVRIRRDFLHDRAQELLWDDLRADKGRKDSPLRSDIDTFLVSRDDGDWLKMPISYLLKLSLADLLATSSGLPDLLRHRGEQLLNHFTNDNSSPETVSLHVCATKKSGTLGKGLAVESALRFLLTQTLTAYANSRYKLRKSGQTVCVYFSPLPGGRLKKLNSLISDSFYRELFMSPCLSGWQKGEEKKRYMSLCHQTLSRSQLSCIGKLREAGIITRNLVVLPSTSNISLANNGIHISLGSRRLAQWLADPEMGFGPAQEKYFGDLAIKVVEHFLPLFVGTYSAAPYRLDFSDFHPEAALGFLPHELDYTHLRMLWRRWKKKADIRVAGQPVTPFGPTGLDRFFGRIFRLKGDHVPDYRLVDYFVSLLSTDQCPALNGQEGNLDRLKNDLDSHGVFDRHMAPYLLYRLRHLETMGFSGFEGRYYSLFPSFTGDMAEAADLQVLLSAMAYRLILTGSLHHEDIPDNPTLESERRQIFFGAALDIPTFYVRHDSGNRFLRTILEKIPSVRKSKRYPGYLRVKNRDYRLALIKHLRESEAELVEELQAEGLLASLTERLKGKKGSAAARLSRRAMKGTIWTSPLQIPAADFNSRLEEYYRGDLRLQQIDEACDCLAQALGQDGGESGVDPGHIKRTVEGLLDGRPLAEFLTETGADFRQEIEDQDLLRRLAHLIIYAVSLQDGQQNKNTEPHPTAMLANIAHPGGSA